MRKLFWFPSCVGAFAVMSVFMLASVAYATPTSAKLTPDSIPTVIRIDPVDPIVAGEPFTVTGIFYRHVEDGNVGIPNRGVKLYIEPISTTSGPITQTFLVANVFSNKEGRLRWVVRKNLQSGDYRLYFLYQGSPTLRESVATTDLRVLDALPDSARSGRHGAVPVQLSIATAEMPIKAGAPMTVAARLATSSGAPLPGYNLYLHLPGATQQRRTDTSGTATFSILKPFAPGLQSGRVSFLGRNGYAPAEEQIVLEVAPPAPTTLTFLQNAERTMLVGDELTFVARLATNGQPLPEQFVRFFVNGKQRYGVRTDDSGRVVLRLPRDMIAGSHMISVTFRGTAGLVASNAAMPITLAPRALEVRTVPPLQGVEILVREKRIKTDSQGIARLTLEKGGPVLATVLPYESTDPNVRVEFDRWSDGVFSATRKIKITSGITATYQIGFAVSHLIVQDFVEIGSGREVSRSRLSNVTLVNSAGEAVTVSVTGDGVQWLRSNRIIRLDEALVASPVSYQVRNVTVDGTNVVNEGQQRFKVAPNARWTVKLQMHDLAVAVRDALFGFPIGEGMRVAYPSGMSKDVALDQSGRMRIESLSRGSYTVTVQGVMGIRVPTSIALSRNQAVDLAVISYLDVGIVGGSLAVIALGVLLVGRRKVFAGMRQFKLR